MKTNVLLIGFFMFTASVLSQPSAVQDIFNKYAGKEGFTVVDVNSSLFDLLKQCDKNDKDFQKISKLEHVKILVQEEFEDDKLNFYNEVMKSLPANEYKELMVIKDGKQDVKILMKDENERIKELLLVSGGVGDNVLIYISGNFSLNDISELEDMVDVDVDFDDIVENTVEM